MYYTVIVIMKSSVRSLTDNWLLVTRLESN